jgi:hypothetical protein
VNVHVKVLPSLSPEKFNTFNTFNTFVFATPAAESVLHSHHAFGQVPVVCHLGKTIGRKDLQCPTPR